MSAAARGGQGVLRQAAELAASGWTAEPARSGFGSGRSLLIVANDVLLAEIDGAGLMAGTDGLESHPIRVRRLRCGSPRSVDLVEPTHQVPAVARRDGY